MSRHDRSRRWSSRSHTEHGAARDRSEDDDTRADADARVQRHLGWRSRDVDARIRVVAHAAAALEHHQLHLLAPRREAGSPRGAPRCDGDSGRHRVARHHGAARQRARLRARTARLPRRETARSMHTSRSSRWRLRRAPRSRASSRPWNDISPISRERSDETTS